MNKVLLIAGLAILGLCSVVLGESMTITGAGATFPEPIYVQWAHKYEGLTGVKLNYQANGSGGGIANIKAKVVDFGATDAPLKGDELEKVGLLQFPMIIGGVVPVVNVKGVKAGEMKLTGEILADIYLGKITEWNDAKIKELNKDIELPAKHIGVVHRSDGSGTTWLFTNYLDKVSKAWHEKVGTGKEVAWPTGFGGKGNAGVANYVQRIDGAIGYVEYAYALQTKMTFTQVENRSGKFVSPKIETFQAAAENADWTKTAGFGVVLTDQSGEKSWPITGASFILIYKDQPKEKQQVAKAMLSFFDWCYKHGQQMAQKLDYVPIPKNVMKLVQSAWENEVKSDGKQLWP